MAPFQMQKKVIFVKTEPIFKKKAVKKWFDPVTDFPVGALGTCLERQICRGGIGRQFFNKFLQINFFFLKKKIFKKIFFTKIMYI